MADRTPWRRWLAEGSIIVLSILLAFWIDAWWDGRQARGLEADALLAVAAEVESNRTTLDATEMTLARYQEDVDRFLRADPPDLSPMSADSISSWIAGLSVPPRYDPGESAITRLSSLPSTRASERGTRVRMLLSRLLSEHEDSERRASRMSDVSAELFAHLASYAGRTAGLGRDRIDPMVGRAGPDVFGELRADDRFVALVVQMAHWREVYRSELDRVRETLGELSALLDTPG